MSELGSNSHLVSVFILRHRLLSVVYLNCIVYATNPFVCTGLWQGIIIDRMISVSHNKNWRNGSRGFSFRRLNATKIDSIHFAHDLHNIALAAQCLPDCCPPFLNFLIACHERRKCARNCIFHEHCGRTNERKKAKKWNIDSTTV